MDPVDRNWRSLSTEEHALYNEVVGLLVEEMSLRDKVEDAREVQAGLTLLGQSLAVDLARGWNTEGLDLCRERLHANERRLAALGNLLEEFRRR